MFSLKRIATMFLLSLIVCLIATQSYSQAFKFGIPTFNEIDEAKGFIVKNNTYTQGFLYFNKNKPDQVDFSTGRKGSLTTYTADELTEFGIDESRIRYVAKSIPNEQAERVFLEEIIKDSLYYLHRDKAFFRGVSLAPLNKQELLPFLQSMSNPKANWNKELHLFKLKHQPLQYFARNNLDGKSPTVLFLHTGVFLSFNNSALMASNRSGNKVNHQLDNGSSKNISAGVFADLPAWPFNNLSFMTQLGYGKMRFYGTKKLQRSLVDSKLELDYLRFAIMPKYTIRLSKLRLFAQAGPTLMYQFRHDSQSIETMIEGDVVWLKSMSGLSVKKTMPGAEVGAGISFFYLPKHYLSLQYSQAKNFSKYFNISNQSLTISANL